MVYTVTNSGNGKKVPLLNSHLELDEPKRMAYLGPTSTVYLRTQPL